MKKHTINAEDFDGYEAEHILASSAGKGVSKRLSIITTLPEGSSSFRITANKETVLSTSNFTEAVAEYNEW